MIKDIYLDIESRILSLLDEEGKPIFKHTDLWNNNVMFIEQETPFETPACFIEFLPIQHEALDEGQTFEFTPMVRLHVVTQWLESTAKNVPEEKRLKAMEYLDHFEMLFKHLLSDANNDLFTKLISTTINHDHARYVDSMETYELQTYVIEPE